MTLKSINKKFALASVTLLTAASLNGIVNTGAVHAVSATANVSNGSVNIYAEQAAPTIVGGVQDNQSGTTNDGSAQNNVTGGIMANVQFTATQVTPKTDGSKFDTTANGGSYDTVANSAITVTTNASGLANFTGLTTGYWLFHQDTTVAGITSVADFIVSVNTTDTGASVVNVYPKQSMTSANSNTGTETTNGTNPIDGSPTPVQNGGTATNWAPNNETMSATEGDKVNFILTPTFDPSMTNNTTTPAGGQTTTTQATYTITETIKNGATGLNTIDPTTIAIAGLTAGTDFNTPSITPSGNDLTVTITLTPQGIINASKLTTDGDSVTPGTQLQVTVPGTVKTDFSGTITSNYVTDVVNAFGASLSNTNPSTTTETVNVGAVQITKIDGLTKTPLEGAKFVLVAASSAQDAINRVTAGTNLADPSTGTTGLTSGTDGTLEFKGVNLVDNSAGTGAETSTTYYAVETTAPAGYQVPAGTAAAFQVTANLPTALTNNTIENNKSFNLPFTGGVGIAAVLVIASAAGAGAIVIRRKKNEDDREEVSK